ncbi:MAG: hypothetical protein JXB32_14435 [Deltaproteobacteria bacterium]|nr:hypothetical protein [Deltaproteobacteria bacterium]
MKRAAMLAGVPEHDGRTDAERCHCLREFAQQIEAETREATITGTINVSAILVPLQRAVRLFPEKMAEGFDDERSAVVWLLAALEGALVRLGLPDAHEVHGGPMFGDCRNAAALRRLSLELEARPGRGHMDE